MRKIIKTTIVLALAVVMLCSSALAASYGAKVLAPSMSVYNSEKTVVGALGQGTSIKVTDMSGDWVKISYKGHTGFARLQDVCFNSGIKAVSKQDTPIAFVTKASYSDNTYYKATLAAGVGVYVVGKKGDLALISNAAGSALGYVKLSALTKA